MEYDNRTQPHPQLLDTLFAYKHYTSSVFHDILDLHSANYVAITRIDRDNRYLILSSMPAVEYNLFSSDLWRFDNNYNPHCFNINQIMLWSDLYDPLWYDELYYLRQIQHNFTMGFSLASVVRDYLYIYSFAGQYLPLLPDDFLRMGEYCANRFEAIFESV